MIINIVKVGIASQAIIVGVFAFTTGVIVTLVLIGLNKMRHDENSSK